MSRIMKHNGPRFSDKDKDLIESKIQEVDKVVGIEGYEITDDEVVLNGLQCHEDRITIGHPRTAIAFLDALLIGYKLGSAEKQE